MDGVLQQPSGQVVALQEGAGGSQVPDPLHAVGKGQRAHDAPAVPHTKSPCWV